MATTSIIPDNISTKKKTDAYGNPLSSSGQTTSTGVPSAATATTYNQLPYMQQNNPNQIIPLSPDAIAKGNEKAIQTAQQTVATQPDPATNYLNTLVRQKTEGLLQDPTQGLNANSYKRNILDQFNRQQSEAMEAAREKLGDTSQSGELQNAFLKNALFGAQQRADLGTQIDYDISNINRDALIDALAAGRAGIDTTNNAFSNYLNNIATVAGMAEPMLERQYQTGERIASQIYNTSERLDQNSFTAVQNELDRIEERAARTENVDLTKWVENKREETQLRLQTNDMTHDESMAYLQDQLANATADNDVERQKVIMGYAATIKLEEDERNFGYETALTNLKGEIDQAIADGDNENAKAMQKAELEYRVNRDIQDFALRVAAQEIEAKGVNMQWVENQYNQILSAYGEEAANEFIASTLATQGIDMSSYRIADKKQQAIEALNTEYKLMQQQFLTTHPEYRKIVYMNGSQPTPIDELSADGLQAFNDYYNYTMYGELTEEQKEERRLAGWLTQEDINNAQIGDKFKISEETTASNGMIVPPGEYNVEIDKAHEGQKFWGTYRDVERIYLVDQADPTKRYMVEKTKSGRQGNLVSGLWAEE